MFIISSVVMLLSETANKIECLLKLTVILGPITCTEDILMWCLVSCTIKFHQLFNLLNIEGENVSLYRDWSHF